MRSAQGRCHAEDSILEVSSLPVFFKVAVSQLAALGVKVSRAVPP